MTRVGRSELFLLYALTESAKALAYFERATELAARREVIQEGIERRENQSVFDALKLGLYSAASVSRVFWPGGARDWRAANARAVELRELCELPADNAAHQLGKRTWRDHVEHLDERIDARIEDGGTPFIGIEIVQQDPEMAQHMAVVPIGYDPVADAILFYGEPQPVGDLRAALIDVRDRCSVGLAKIHEVHAGTAKEA